MISLEKARVALADGSTVVAVDGRGDLCPVPPGTVGPAVALVSPVSDALKSVGSSGLVEGSIDRDGVWAVHQLVFSADAVYGLPDEFDSVQAFFLAVEANGFEWGVSQTPSGL